MRGLKIYSTVFLMGGVGYCLLELIWRGYTHISMGLAGGLCFSGLYYIEDNYKDLNIFVKCLIGSVLITFVELMVGLTVNIGMELMVWDYSDRFLNIMGQVCPLLSLVWFGISFPAYKLCERLIILFSLKGEKNE